MSAAADTLARQVALRERMQAIVDLPEAEGRSREAFALAIRGDVPVGRARVLLSSAPAMGRIEDISAWADAISVRPVLEIMR